jgi:hypothetical protein
VRWLEARSGHVFVPVDEVWRVVLRRHERISKGA